MDKKSYKTLNNSCKPVELLAPAKDIECAITAINCGADAVYIGASDFGARKKAGNSLEDIKKIVDYAHIFNVKIYVRNFCYSSRLRNILCNLCNSRSNGNCFRLIFYSKWSNYI